MTKPPLTYVQLLEANKYIQNTGEETYWLCVTRTVQNSKLFPVSPYIMFSYLNAFYRYPDLLRKIDAAMPAEEIGDRARNMGSKLQTLCTGWCLPAFYLLGREWLIAMGMLRPQDAAEDIVYVLDFWKRFQLSWHRNDSHVTNRDFGLRSQALSDRRLEVFAADMFECSAGDELQTAAHGFMATASQYCFLVACESRLSLSNSGPYRLDEKRELLIRDFLDLGSCSLPWLDGVADEVPYNNLTVTMAVEDCHFHLVDDWGSFEAEPDFTPDKLVGFGLYTSDPLSDGYVPVGMESREALVRTLHELNDILKKAMLGLWARMADWSRDQLLDAGAFVYYSAIKDLAHVAGVYAVEDWFEIDPRVERFRPLLNDEYGNVVLGDMVGTVSLPAQQVSPFVMMQHSDRPTRVLTPLPYSILAGEDYVPRIGVIQRGQSSLPPKVDRYQTSRGRLTLEEYNRAAPANVPAHCAPEYRFLCETWLKYNPDDPQAQEMYRREQSLSRTIRDRGTSFPEDG